MNDALVTPLRLGICGICDHTRIFTEGLHPKPTEYYTEIYLMFSDETIARHGVCTFCAQSLTEEKIKLVMERIRNYNLTQMVGWATEAQFKNMQKLQVKTWDQDKHTCVEKFKEIKDREHKEKCEQKEKKEKDAAK